MLRCCDLRQHWPARVPVPHYERGPVTSVCRDHWRWWDPAPGTISSCSPICHPSLHLAHCAAAAWVAVSQPRSRSGAALHRTTAGHQHHLARLPRTWDTWGLVRTSGPGWALNAGPRTLRPGHCAEAGAGAGVAALRGCPAR